MSGNVPYCPSRSGVQILTGYDYNNLHSGTITFSTPFTPFLISNAHFYIVKIV